MKNLHEFASNCGEQGVKIEHLFSKRHKNKKHTCGDIMLKGKRYHPCVEQRKVNNLPWFLWTESQNACCLQRYLPPLLNFHVLVSLSFTAIGVLTLLAPWPCSPEQNQQRQPELWPLWAQKRRLCNGDPPCTLEETWFSEQRAPYKTRKNHQRLKRETKKKSKTTEKNCLSLSGEKRLSTGRLRSGTAEQSPSVLLYILHCALNRLNACNGVVFGMWGIKTIALLPPTPFSLPNQFPCSVLAQLKKW